MLGEHLDVIGRCKRFHDAIDRLNGTHGMVHEDSNIFFHEDNFWRPAVWPTLVAVSALTGSSFLNAEYILPLFFTSPAGGYLLGLMLMEAERGRGYIAI